MRRALWVVSGLAITGALLGSGPTPPAKTPLPEFGTKLELLPPGPGRETAEKACLACHSTDMIRQQRLTEGQWTANVKKMTGWGADVPEEKRDELVKYLAQNFGPDNDRFRPAATRPLGR
jgi:hypothetical protein